MDRASACGAEDPGSIPGERTKPLLALALAVLAALPARADFGTTDGVLTVAERAGWSTAAPRPGAVLTLSRGEGTLWLTPAADDAPPFSLVAAQGVRLRRAGRPVSEPESRASAAGIPYLVAAASAPWGGPPSLLGAVSVDRARYTVSAEGVETDEALALLDGLDRHRPAAPAGEAAAPSGPAQALLFGGTVRLPRPERARLAPQSDGWTVAVGERWSLGVWDGGPGGGPGAEAFLKERGGELERARSCRGADPVATPLANGWTVTMRPFLCPGALPGMVVVLGAVERGGRPPFYLAGDYGTVAGQDAAMSWLASGTDAGQKPLKPAWPAASAARTPWALGAAAAGTLAAAAFLLRRR